MPDKFTDQFDETYDVVVVGYGFAGGSSAISAHDNGAKVLLIEKMDAPGGISICAGGGVRVAKEAAPVIDYVMATNNGTTPRDVTEAFVEEMVQIEDWIRAMGKVNDAHFIYVDRPGNYPYPGYDSMSFLEVDDIPGYDSDVEFPHARSHRNGPKLFKLLYDNVNERGIEVRLSTKAVRLIQGPGDEIRGIWIEGPDGKQKAIKTKKGVILACGGFEANYDMQKQYWQMAPVMTAAFRGNTGDGIKMALDVGADLWHMWHYHGSYGWRHPDPEYPFTMRMKRLPDWTPQVREADVEMAWILVDQEGQRFGNEYVPYVQDTGHQIVSHFDPATMSFPRIPAFAIVDQEGCDTYRLGATIFNDTNIEPYHWSDDNSKEIENGILTKCDTIADLAKRIGCDESTLAKTIERWNAIVDAGEDTDFKRPPKTMMKLSKAPYYVGEVWPCVSNTQGGPVHDGKYRVLNSYGEPVPRLYEAGECGGIWGFLYLAGANLTECFVGGRVAGRETAALPDWDA